MAELVDASDLKSDDRKIVRVRVPLSAKVFRAHGIIDNTMPLQGIVSGLSPDGSNMPCSSNG